MVSISYQQGGVGDRTDGKMRVKTMEIEQVIAVLMLLI